MLDVKFKIAPGHTSERRWTQESKVATIFWNVTYGCNHRCDVCFLDAGDPRADELSTDEALHFLRDAYATGVRDIIISGGEPFVRQDLVFLLSEMARLGMSARIASNGTLVTPQLLREIRRKTLVKSFQISLDTLDPDLYAELHGCSRDNFERAHAATRFVRDHGFHTTVSVRLTAETLGGIPAMLNRASEEGWATVTVHCPLNTRRAIGAPPQDADYLGLLSTAVETFVALPERWLIETYIPWAPFHPAVRAWAKRVRIVHRGCAAGRSHIAVHPSGDVSPCVCLDVPAAHMGNVRESNVRELFAGSPVGAIFRRPQESGICTTCNNVETCGGGCRAAAFALTGRIDGQDMACPVWRSRPERLRNAEGHAWLDDRPGSLADSRSDAHPT